MKTKRKVLVAIELGIALLLCGVLAAPASTVAACPAGYLSDVIGTTCDIGKLQFTFTGFESQNFLVDSGNIIYNQPWSASDFYFTPYFGLGKGFTLTFLGDPQELDAPLNGYGYDFAQLDYSVRVIDFGGSIFGLSAPFGFRSLDAWGHTQSEALSQADLVSDFGGLQCDVYDVVDQQNGVIDERTQFYDPCGWYRGHGMVQPFNLSAFAGDGAYWDGAPITLQFDYMPEPGTLVLFGTGLISLAGVVRRRLAI